ncbi:MAG TPA: baseplate J/gp47 family protein [Blastocatellia bacterium]|nr:baseplate J/gp47 family protein [Blastocatellia bacterium]
MPIQIPTLDDRRYQALLDEALARIPVHTPEWTNFNKSDPGVTLIEIFAFLTENLLYRSNQIPERNRRTFLKSLGIGLQPASSARGLVTFLNDRGPLETVTIDGELEVRAGQVPFRTTQGLDVLPIEAQLFYKRELKNPSDQLRSYYNQLYASFLKPQLSASAQLYQTATFPLVGGVALDLGRDSLDGSLWIALLARAGDKPFDDNLKNQVRDKIGGKTLNLGIVPALGDATRALRPGGSANPEGEALLTYEVPIGETLSNVASERTPRYRTLAAVPTGNVLLEPGTVQITLPQASELNLWDNLDPLESGVLDFPPAIEDSNLSERLITWLRVRVKGAAPVKLQWAGINSVFVSQRAHVANELLPDGNGAPDQAAVLSKTPVIVESVRLVVITQDGNSEQWTLIDDLMSAGPEVPVPDLRKPPGSPALSDQPVKVFVVSAESGEIKFGDGQHGARPPLGAKIRAGYDYGVGRAGNVNAASINNSPALSAGFKVTNPVATWGGAEAETVTEGEKQISRYLQHRDRLVSAADFKTITRRTPGVDIGRVDVLPAFSPELGSTEPGDAPGAVTLMIIPKYDPLQPDAPMPNRNFLDTVCAYLDPRRLVTMEVFLRGPVYKHIWISIGINVESGRSIAEVREAVKSRLLQFLSPLLGGQETSPDQSGDVDRGWPLRKPVVALELMARASGVTGVSSVNGVLLAEGVQAPNDKVDMRGLELPRVAGISVSVGEPALLDELRGRSTATQSGAPVVLPGPPGAGQQGAPTLVPLPVIPDECK